MGTEWTKYRDGAAPWPTDLSTAEAIIIDALTQEGITAWHGDAVQIIHQIIGLG